MYIIGNIDNQEISINIILEKQNIYRSFGLDLL